MMVKWVYDILISPSLMSISPSLAWSKPSFAHFTFIEKLHRLYNGFIISVHYQKIIHRDIKPSNLLRADSGEVSSLLLHHFKYRGFHEKVPSATGYFRKVYRSLQFWVPHNILKYFSIHKSIEFTKEIFILCFNFITKYKCKYLLDNIFLTWKSFGLLFRIKLYLGTQG